MQKDLEKGMESKRKVHITRLDFDVEFKDIIGRIDGEDNKDCEELIKMLSSVNNRQKLKIMKKCIDSEQPNELMKKNFVVKYFRQLLLKEYMYGCTQNKPTLLVLLREVDSIQAIEFDQIERIFGNLGLECYQQCRNIVELLQFWHKQQHLRSRGKQLTQKQGVINNKLQQSQIYQKLYTHLQNQFQTGRQMILSQTYNYKWLQYFIDILRSLNTYIRFVPFLSPNIKHQLSKDLNELLSKSVLVTKQVLTQLYLLLVYICSEGCQPLIEGQCLERDKLLRMHYLHAVSIVEGKETLTKLMELLQRLREIEHRCQFVPILAQAFDKQWKGYTRKREAFDLVIQLFDVGRAVYAHLQQIFGIILEDPEGCNWTFEGNSQRKFFIAAIVLKHFPTKHVQDRWPDIVKDVMSQAGSMTVPYAMQCAEILFRKLYEQAEKDYQKWSQTWIQVYLNHLKSSITRAQVRGIVEFIHPILLKIDASPELLKKVLSLSNKCNNVQLAVISLLKCFKQVSKIEIDCFKRCFYHFDDPNIEFRQELIGEMLVSRELMIALKAFQFVTGSVKSAQLMEPLEFELALRFYRGSLKTSLPEFRKSYLTATKRMFERLRNVYDVQLREYAMINTQKNSIGKVKSMKRIRTAKPYFSEFKTFICTLIDLCYEQIIPDAIFELANPALQILLLICTYFGVTKIEYKKGKYLQPSPFLQNTNFFSKINFDNLLVCLQSSYQSVRALAHQLLKQFTHLQQNNIQLSKLWIQSLQYANRLSIRSYEQACRVISLIGQSYPSLIKLSNKYNLVELNVGDMLFMMLMQRYEVFKVEFARQNERYYKNLTHGLLTCFSYLFEDLAVGIKDRMEQYEGYFGEIKEFLQRFFEMVCLMLQFSVQVCSSNISTVVLDTIFQPQTDRKYKVDCRGHFIDLTTPSTQTYPPQKPTIGDYLNSTSLLTAMQGPQDDQSIQNNLVVSFYLLTREAGLLFQSIGSLVAHQRADEYVPTDGLVDVVNSYFYALINLKHMGSVDRIANGLGKMAKVVFGRPEEGLRRMPEIMLEKLMSSLRESQFTNILRRSAGAPYAFSCLLRSEGLGKKLLIEKTIKTLLTMAKENMRNDKVNSVEQIKINKTNKTSQTDPSIKNSIELCVHSLNILKKLFQDSDLKFQLDPYVSQAFIIAMQGFSSEQWGIRNSSLMVFSVLANRTVGIKPTLNLLQFFHKCPQLLPYITKELQQLSFETMYPPLYPIVLLLSRLLPFDLKRNSQRLDSSPKQVRKGQLLRLLPLIERAGMNNNHMGRVMTAKATLPFMDVQNILEYCLDSLEGLDNDSQENQKNNWRHFQLTKCLYLLDFYKQIHEKDISKQLQLDVMKRIIGFLNRNINYIAKLKCPNVAELYVKICQHFLTCYLLQQFIGMQKWGELITAYGKQCVIMLQGLIRVEMGYVIKMNMGHSMFRKQCLKFQWDLCLNCCDQPKCSILVVCYGKFVQGLVKAVHNDKYYFVRSDNEVIEQQFGRILQLLRRYPEQTKSQNQFIQSLKQFAKVDLSDRSICDAIAIRIVQLRTILNIQLTKTHLTQLQSIIMNTSNHFLKIALFKYFQMTILFQKDDMKMVDLLKQLLKTLLFQFSDPEQLEQLRQCCVEYIETIVEPNQEHYIVYIRLLEDQQYEIRLQTGRILSKLFKLGEQSEMQIKKWLLRRLSIKQFGDLFELVSDYSIKLKNNSHQRIFSYDKPNKYRSDIANVVYTLLNNEILKGQLNEVGKVMFKVEYKQCGSEQGWRQRIGHYGDILRSYREDVLGRNQYQFETIVRLFVLVKGKVEGVGISLDQLRETMWLHPLLRNIYETYEKDHEGSKCKVKQSSTE